MSLFWRRLLTVLLVSFVSVVSKDRQATEGYSRGIQADQIAGSALAKAVGPNVQALMLNKASEVRDQRDQRIALSQTHVNPLKWLGMGFLGWLTLLSVLVVHVDRPRAAFVAGLLFALAAAPTAAIVLIQGNPFQQPSTVSPAPISAAVAGLRQP